MCLLCTVYLYTHVVVAYIEINLLRRTKCSSNSCSIEKLPFSIKRANAPKCPHSVHYCDGRSSLCIIMIYFTSTHLSTSSIHKFTAQIALCVGLFVPCACIFISIWKCSDCSHWIDHSINFNYKLPVSLQLYNVISSLPRRSRIADPSFAQAQKRQRNKAKKKENETLLVWPLRDLNGVRDISTPHFTFTFGGGGGRVRDCAMCVEWPRHERGRETSGGHAPNNGNKMR